MKRERGVHELFEQDPHRAEWELFGRIAQGNRRGFLKGAGLATMASLLGAAIPFHRNMPAGFIPVALAQSNMPIPGKDGLTVLNDRPLNAETPPHLLDDEVTPVSRHFIRDNGMPPKNTDGDSWMLTVDGEVGNPLNLSIADLKKRFEVVTRRLVIECGGNGRAGFNPPASGNQWTYGAVACAEWTGVRMGDVLKAAGIKSNAVYTGHYGADAHLSGDPKKLPISRGIPMRKAMDPETLIAFAMNGGALHPANGAPLRVVAPGWPGSCSQKWLKRIQVRNKVHDGPKMGGDAYRVPRYPVAPGQKVPKEDFVIIEAMPIKSLITYPQTSAAIKGAGPVEVRGHAWAGDRTVKSVEVSIDFGATWIKTDLAGAPNRLSSRPCSRPRGPRRRTRTSGRRPSRPRS